MGRWAWIVALLVCPVWPVIAQEDPEGPKDEKAKKTFAQGIELARHHKLSEALDTFKKANKQDGGHCVACEKMIVRYGVDNRDWKAAENAAADLVTEAQGQKALALARYELGIIFLRQAFSKNKEEFFSKAHEQLNNALAVYPNFPDGLFADGQALAHLKQDDAAKARFEQFARMTTPSEAERQRALRFASHPELARARMAPPFEVVTTSGEHFSLDNLQGKVVLIDFWATWCPSCREALPHMRDIVKKFQGEPLVVLSVSLDEDQTKWKDFVAKNGMTWPQYCDGGFTGELSRMFDVEAIPQTFTIDVNGVLQDQHIGDASIEGKLKKLITQAHELEAAKKPGS